MFAMEIAALFLEFVSNCFSKPKFSDFPNLCLAWTVIFFFDFKQKEKDYESLIWRGRGG